MCVGRRGYKAVDQLSILVDSYMHLHSEVVLVAFLRGVHIRIPLLLPDFGR